MQKDIGTSSSKRNAKCDSDGSEVGALVINHNLLFSEAFMNEVFFSDLDLFVSLLWTTAAAIAE